MRRNYSVLAFGLMLFAVLACRGLQKTSSRENLFEGSHMADAAVAFKEKVGGPIKAFDLEITADKATLRAQDPKQPDNLNEYVYSKGSCSGPRPLQTSQLPILGPWEKALFALDEIDLAATPQVVKTALARTNVESGKVTTIVISLGVVIAGDSRRHEPRWKIDVEGPRESASASANAKGEITGLDLSRTTRANKQDYLGTKALEDAVKQIKQKFGGQVYLAMCDVSKDRISFLAASSPTTDELHRYQYDLSGTNPSLGDTGPDLGPKYKFKNHEFYFTFDEIDFSRTSSVLETAFAKSGLAHPIIPSMNFRRAWKMDPDRVEPLEWRVIVKDQENSAGKGTYVTFDGKGTFLAKGP